MNDGQVVMTSHLWSLVSCWRHRASLEGDTPSSLSSHSFIAEQRHTPSNKHNIFLLGYLSSVLIWFLSLFCVSCQFILEIQCVVVVVKHFTVTHSKFTLKFNKPNVWSIQMIKIKWYQSDRWTHLYSSFSQSERSLILHGFVVCEGGDPTEECVDVCVKPTRCAVMVGSNWGFKRLRFHLWSNLNPQPKVKCVCGRCRMNPQYVGQYCVFVLYRVLDVVCTSSHIPYLSTTPPVVYLLTVLR